MKISKILLAIGCLVALSLHTGCVGIIAAQMRAKLPSAEAEEVNLVVNIVGAGGGGITAKNVSTKGGKLVADEYHEYIQTGGGSYTLDAKGVDVNAVRRKKPNQP